jgi:peroxiredoxin Q/BCP
LLLLLITGTGPMQAATTELKTGAQAPDFNLEDQAGKRHQLADYHGRWLVLYFYPKDDTPGCTREACEFRDDHIKFGQANSEVIGISIDNSDSHAAFAKKYSLPFPLLADPGGKVSDRYGSYFSFGPLKYARRHTFIIDPDGKIARIYRSVQPATHSDEVLSELKSLQSR